MVILYIGYFSIFLIGVAMRNNSTVYEWVIPLKLIIDTNMTLKTKSFM